MLVRGLAAAKRQTRCSPRLMRTVALPVALPTRRTNQRPRRGQAPPRGVAQLPEELDTPKITRITTTNYADELDGLEAQR
jgi:hypothetical protein